MNKKIFVETTEEIAKIFFNELNSRGIDTSQEAAKKIVTKINEMMTYVPKIAILGKTGVGKSSLCNALFGKDIAEIDDVRACTKKPNQYLLSIGSGGGIKLVDVPGVGESEKSDMKYFNLYKKIIPEMDLILWLIKADDRAFSIEERFYKQVVKPHIYTKPFIVVINQVDKIAPTSDWDKKNCHPGLHQKKNILEKRKVVCELFNLERNRVIEISAIEKYNLGKLLTKTIQILPNSKRISILREAKKEFITKKAEKGAEEGFLKEVWDTAKKVIKKVANKVVYLAVPIVIKKAGEFFKKWLFKK
jgi:small GTP-binding protein